MLWVIIPYMKYFIICLSIATFFLLLCLFLSFRHKTKIAGLVRGVLLAVLVPVLANYIIIFSDTNAAMAELGYCVYLMGTDVLLYILILYAAEYCQTGQRLRKFGNLLAVFLVLDFASIGVNHFTKHVFTLKPVKIEDGMTYNSIVSGPGHISHLALTLLLVFLFIFIFVWTIFKSSKLYLEKYMIILGIFVAVCLWEFYYILSNTPIDESMIGYEICGILLYYFTLEYRPFFLRMVMFDKVVSNTNSAVFFFDEKLNCLYMNPRCQEMLKIPANDYDSPKIIFKAFLDGVNVNRQEKYTAIQYLDMPDGKHVYEVEYSHLRDKSSKPLGAFITINDRTEKDKQIARERYAATHDLLTGLYNMAYFTACVEKRLKEDTDTSYKIMVSDIKDFKLVNDIFGKATGDDVLKQIALSIKDSAKPRNIYGRIGGDRFAVLIADEDYDEKRIVQNSNKKIRVRESIEYPIVNHIGVYSIDDRNSSTTAMIDRAIMAIATIKNDANRFIAHYDSAIRKDRLWQQKVLGNTDEAIITRQFKPFLQAQVDADGKVEGAEVLVRWLHPEEGLMTPGRFIEILENSGKIVELDTYMWREACRILKEWRDRGWNDLYLSVNISPKDFYFIDIYKVVSGLIDEYGLKPSDLRLEITETVMMSDLDKRLGIIEKLRNNGFVVEMDDFGSGYSSLNMLKDLPVDILKIDMVFLRETKSNERARIILRQIINMAKELSMPVITEGVETEEQVNTLRDMGCDMFQGYFFARPVSLEEFENKLTSEGDGNPA